MLSRIADSLYWIGRYVERADQTARILDVDLQVLAEDATRPAEDRLQEIHRMFGRPAAAAEDLTAQRTLDLLATDRSNPSSVAGSLLVARENARGAREVLSTEVWEALNTTRLELPRTVHPSRMHAFFRWSKDRCAVINGLVEASMVRDEAWLFLRIGQLIERIDMISRILQAHDLEDTDDGAVAVLLRTCSAHEAFIRAYRGQVSAARATEFLLLDSLFPRSIAHCLAELETALETLARLHGTAFDRLGTEDPARRAVGAALASLRYRRLGEVTGNLQDEMEHLQTAMRWISGALDTQYFSPQQGG
ncbi:alpha-E domain-containing protein [Brachybacterium sp. EF45031]|uniref:alpha-E domain-containing protein n=1 Tax=Brachybacterium sillae TaxID=2810536 RepID=UPI00217D6F23|nr:alpha-E domain-containing protein [Brachybacterium sillae]MCS6710778.1 alpha-E domain-containing protein [Brachybacterium sillae]